MSIKKSGLGIIMAGAAAAATTIIATVCAQRNAKKYPIVLHRIMEHWYLWEIIGEVV